MKIRQQPSLQSDNIPMNITFQNLIYSIQDNNKEKQILKGITGICPSSSITAILGSSGAGKSTLLNALCKRIVPKNNNKFSGTLLVNGLEYNQNDFCKFANYVMQDDVLTDSLTVRECLMFAANLKVKGTKEEKEKIVNQTILDLKLKNCQNTLIGGNSFKGISGGERKRTSIGFEMICDPQALFLDEPTSGLDRQNYFQIQVISRLKAFAHDKNKTVVLTIHQPSSDIWNMLDRIMLMVDGRFVYQGNGSSHILNYFQSNGFNCPIHNNPADYLLEIMSKDESKGRDNSLSLLSNYDGQLISLMDEEIKQNQQNQIEKLPEKEQQGYWIQQYYLFLRSFLVQMRNPILTKAKIGQVISLSLFLGLVYFQLPDGKNDPYDTVAVNNKNGLFFFLSQGAFGEALNPCILSIPLERKILFREYNSRLYSITPYFISKLLVDMATDTIIPILFSAILYWMVGLRPDFEAFVFFTVTIVVLQYAGMGAGYFEGCLIDDPFVAMSVAQMIMFPVTAFSGFFKNRKDLASWMSWITYLSPFKYAYEAMIQNEYAVTYFIPNPIETEAVQFGKWESLGFILLIGLGFQLLGLYFLKKSTKTMQ